MNLKKRVLVGSPIKQSPAILQEFLNSLSNLKQDTYELHYLFLDNNNEPASSQLLQEFSKDNDSVMIHNYDNENHYVKNDLTHSWNETLIWKVAHMKNIIINIALEYKYDYLFFIDSDIVLHTDTIGKLIQAEKEIISEIFWTKWQPDFPELPQVWLQDHYNLFTKHRDEQISETEALQRQNDFLQKLKNPGVYEVGGLGACTLISREALLKGVNFDELKNISFWGEDRHFCIRAAALNIGMYVDTHYPAYHIYRDTDLEGIQNYKARNRKLDKIGGLDKEKDGEIFKDAIEEYLILLLEQEQLDKASDFILWLEKIELEEAFINIMKSRLFIKQGRLNEVFSYLKDLEESATDKRAGLLLADLAQQNGEIYKALKLYDKYLAIGDTQKSKAFELLKRLDKPKISLISSNSAGCNATALWENIPSNFQQNYDVRVFKEMPYNEYDSFVEESDLVVTTQANYPFNDKQINLELWHGFPLKAMANMDVGDKRTAQTVKDWWGKIDLISSYSSTFNTIFNACIGTDIRKFHITGAPRNDLLNKGNRAWLEKQFNINLEAQKVVFYTPTFRSSHFNPNKNEGSKQWNNLFGFENFDFASFNDFLEDNNIYLFTKLHWVEENLLKEQLKLLNSSRVKLIEESQIETNNLDFYEILGAADALITDYSSIYFDYLLLNRPILFIPVDIDIYKDKRGFLLEPYDAWTPGPKVTSQIEFQKELLFSFNNHSYFETDREKLKTIVHHYRDFSSSQRVWSLVEKELELKRLNELYQNHQDQNSLAIELNSLIEMNNFEECMNLVQTNERLILQNAELSSMAASVYYANNDLKKSLYFLKNAVLINPCYFDAIYSLALIHEQLGNHEKALLFYEKAYHFSLNEKSDQEVANKLRLLIRE
ncbi:CDP-glycerol glycerophosphotransferase family protein [Saccharibacillus sp. CPCC 101409]|uniref:CDP-glycerol glycerophosphotransferase family protein n=1 Tax=Saccharibacillus sp. CPCC 101409 TaxID=3058041 RepID=UPI002673B185|nr:CDP-glycerol glycerophosphotransferase family protein [Saccharibacillus sp. CPCC 101409]MDO3412077.1 CDP-glycerol glycerophosphotransferase family protein [Saccharibacillus sp. CPCC 101409]